MSDYSKVDAAILDQLMEKNARLSLNYRAANDIINNQRKQIDQLTIDIARLRIERAEAFGAGYEAAMKAIGYD